MKTKIMFGLIIISFILSGGTSFAQPSPEEYVEPGQEQEKFSPNIAVWFKLNITKNEAIDLIEFSVVSNYSLSEPGWDEESWLDNIGGMAVIEVPKGSEQEYIQKFKESDIVETSDLNKVFEPNGQNEQEKENNNLILIIGIIVIIILVIFLIWFKFFKK